MASGRSCNQTACKSLQRSWRSSIGNLEATGCSSRGPNSFRLSSKSSIRSKQRTVDRDRAVGPHLTARGDDHQRPSASSNCPMLCSKESLFSMPPPPPCFLTRSDIARCVPSRSPLSVFPEQHRPTIPPAFPALASGIAGTTRRAWAFRLGTERTT